MNARGGAKHPAKCTPPANAPIAFAVQLLAHEPLDIRILVWVQGGRDAFVAAPNFLMDHATVHLVNDVWTRA